jgi:hypothetical protein
MQAVSFHPSITSHQRTQSPLSGGAVAQGKLVQCAILTMQLSEVSSSALGGCLLSNLSVCRCAVLSALLAARTLQSCKPKAHQAHHVALHAGENQCASSADCPPPRRC